MHFLQPLSYRLVLFLFFSLPFITGSSTKADTNLQGISGELNSLFFLFQLKNLCKKKKIIIITLSLWFRPVWIRERRTSCSFLLTSPCADDIIRTILSYRNNPKPSSELLCSLQSIYKAHNWALELRRRRGWNPSCHRPAAEPSAAGTWRVQLI